jgi:hypothetical protein
MQLTIGYRRTTLARLCASTPLVFGTPELQQYTFALSYLRLHEI